MLKDCSCRTVPSNGIVSLDTPLCGAVLVCAIHRAEVPADEDLTQLSATNLLERRSKPFLTLVALMAILDPPRDEAIEAVKVAHRAGITVKMITGVGTVRPFFDCAANRPVHQLHALWPAAGVGTWHGLKLCGMLRQVMTDTWGFAV